MKGASHLECTRCGRRHAAHRLVGRCDCGGALTARYAGDVPGLDALRERPGGMWRYRELLPVVGDPVTLGEPETPLLEMPALSEELGVDVFLKDDGLLPGGTFKARGAAVGLSRAAELGARGIVMPSAGNAGGVWALYAARAGLPITVTMARSAPAANHAEVRFAGGSLQLVDGSLADAGRRAAEIAQEKGLFLAATFSEPYRLDGKKTAFLEVFDRLGDGGEMRFPDTIVLPVGGGVAAVAAAKAAEEVLVAGWARGRAPRLVGVQASGCAPIARAFERDQTVVEPWDGACDTVAAGLRVPAPAEGALVLERVRASGGSFVSVSEDDILRSVGDLASRCGVFACPEGAATLAAARRLAAAGELEGPVVLYNTGGGAKYGDALARALEGASASG